MQQDTFSAKALILAAAATLFLLVGGFVAWAMFAQIDAGIRLHGRIEAGESHQLLQHPEGGTVAEILVQDGDQVDEGQALLRLDSLALQQDRQVGLDLLARTISRRLRLEAELAGLAFAPPLGPESLHQMLPALGYDTRQEIAHQLAHLAPDEARLMAARQDRLARQLEQMDQRSKQISQQILGLTAQIGARARQVELAQARLQLVQDLRERQLIEISSAQAAEAELARLQGDLADASANLAGAKALLAEVAIEGPRLLAESAALAAEDLGQVRARQAEVAARVQDLDRKIAAMTLTAPMRGRVLGLQAATRGGVLRAGETALQIVPGDAPLRVTLAIPPFEAQGITPGQPVTLRLSALGMPDLPELSGQIEQVSADVVPDPGGGPGHYLAHIQLALPGPQQLGRYRPMPGMPVEAFVQTGRHTPMAYLLHPLRRYFDLAMREG